MNHGHEKWKSTSKDAKPISRHSDLSLLRTPRERGDRRFRDLEKSKPLESWGRAALEALGLVIFFIAVWGVCR